MHTLEILVKVRELADHWEGAAIGMAPLSHGKETEIRKSAAMDFRMLQKSIEKSLEQDAEGMWEQHLNEQKGNNET